jgi:hypothetical protein
MTLLPGSPQGDCYFLQWPNLTATAGSHHGTFTLNGNVPSLL